MANGRANPQQSVDTGERKTYAKIAKRFWWLKLRPSVQQFVRSCEYFQLRKVLRTRQAGRMQAADPLKKPFPTCVFDHLGPFPLFRVFTIEWKPASDGCFRLLRENNGTSSCGGHWARKFEAIHNPTADHEVRHSGGYYQ
ncbi:hypothetical protein T11_12260 [Trichinella zimbabwensis]|uniref:Integrase zinc-binding domain-containing protein n=1 Tax=Trichinella zimbabwensis TaxID=268475 RepID=A0A0V1HP24_9BILA|nr:hypothetical protein T11_12260 [Trichinella zimbabwensis]